MTRPINYTAAMTGVVPVVNHLEANAPEGAWGPLVEVGSSPERLGKVRLITRVWTNDADIWELPVGSNDERVAATSNVFHFSNDSGVNRPTPLVRYANVSRKIAPVYNLPANVVHRAELAERDAEVPVVNEMAVVEAPAGEVMVVEDDKSDDRGGAQAASYIFRVPFEPSLGQYVLQMCSYDQGGGGIGWQDSFH